MTDYDVVYLDQDGNKKDYVITSTDVRKAISNLFEFCPDAKQVVRCTPKPMFTD